MLESPRERNVRKAARRAGLSTVAETGVYQWSERGVSWRRALPDDAVQLVVASHGLLVYDRVQLVLERLAGHAEERHELDRVLGDVERLDDQRSRRHVVRTQRTHAVPPVTCSVFMQVHPQVKKGSPYKITERRVPELIPVLGSQPAGDASHKPGGRLPLLSARPAVTLATLKRAATNFAAW